MEKRKGNLDFELPFGRFSLLFRANGIPTKVYEVVSVTDRANNGSELPEGWRKKGKCGFCVTVRVFSLDYRPEG